MSDFPILKWVNVDGRSVPFTYPQHKKDGGYVETGDENPLPVGNHVMSEGGLWIPEPEVRSTQLTGSNTEKLIITNNDQVFISPGSQLVLDAVDFKGSEFGFNARFSGRRQIEVLVQQLRPGQNTFASIWTLYENEPAEYIHLREKLKSLRTQFIIRNHSDTDVQIRELLITDFS